MSSSNLWGELPEVMDIRTPKMVLAPQAAALQEITKGALTGVLRAINAPDDYIWYQFRVIAPSLGNYSVTLLNVRHQQIAYPCEVISPYLQNKWVACENEADLEGAVKAVLQDPKTRKMLANLLQQIRAENSIAA